MAPGSCMQKLVSPYKFYAAFENSRCRGYITEKFRTGFSYGMVPVAFGGMSRSDYELIAPPDSFVHVDDFGSLKELAKFLLELDKDDKKYNAYFAWKSRLQVEDRMITGTRAYCDLCQELQKPKAQQKPVRRFGNLTKWWYSGCRD
ncbi:FUT6 [Symbiodinium natans]|uniref:Fucosyltransferase n=1 Tax=Symbiodinium natans TaxID=878477 RepID=A0A812UYK3_9DINO|nr:FUT6 [Symbiodinium natans]